MRKAMLRNGCRRSAADLVRSRTHLPDISRHIVDTKLIGFPGRDFMVLFVRVFRKPGNGFRITVTPAEKVVFALVPPLCSIFPFFGCGEANRGACLLAEPRAEGLSLRDIDVDRRLFPSAVRIVGFLDACRVA